MAPVSVTIPKAYAGPLTSANGGYITGLLAAGSGDDHPLEVTIRRPVPLDTELELRHGDEGPQLLHQSRPLATSRRLTFDLTVPPPPDAATAARASAGSLALQREGGVHAICLTCATTRPEGDGLRVHVGPVPGTDDLQAAPVLCHARFCDDEEKMRPEFIAAALDCPGAFVYMQQGIRAGLLGRMSLHILERPGAGERTVVTAWPIAIDGRKHFAGTAMHDEQGRLLAMARSVWFTPPV